MSRTAVYVRTALLTQTLLFLFAAALSFKVWSKDSPTAGPPAKGGTVLEIKNRILESYPNRLQARLEQRDRTLRALASPRPGIAPRFILNVTKRWNAGQTIKVAFKGGNAALHKDIADTVNEWTKYANLKFDFGVTPGGKYRTWSAKDKNFVAEVRVSFDQQGYYSLVGNDSINPSITKPGEESLNLQGFDDQKPSDWKAVALHEFGHAIGFEHEHQSPIAPCDFRFDDDPGYMPTTDSLGQYISDSNDRKPGLYTFLGGPPNNWPKAVVDFNLRQLPPSSAYEVGPFDKLSIMKYFFPAWMFSSGTHSACYTDTENLVISAGDKAGAAKVYPKDEDAKKAALLLGQEAVEAVIRIPSLAPATKGHFENRLKTMKKE